MRDGFTEKYRRTLDLHVVDDGVIDAGTLLTFLREHVTEHPADQPYLSAWHLSTDDVPPTAHVSFGTQHLTLTWTDQDVDAYDTALDAERDAREQCKAAAAAEPVSDGAANLV